MTICTEGHEMLDHARAEGREPQGWRVSREAIGRIARSADRDSFVRTDAGWSWCGLPVVAIAQQGVQLSF
jgi:hypothetical protein